MKNNFSKTLLVTTIFVLTLFVQSSTLFGQLKPQTYHFDKEKKGELSAIWQSFSAISSAGKKVECAPVTCVKFEVQEEANSKNKIVSIASHNGALYDHGHVAYPTNTKLKNGKVSASIQATDTVKGHGGLAVRVVDYKNYYGIRYSFIEGNVMIIKVKDGIASNLKKAQAPDFKGTNKWVKMCVEVNENELVVSLNDKEIIRITDTDPLLSEGYAGLFSRGEKSLISWDNLSITAE